MDVGGLLFACLYLTVEFRSILHEMAQSFDFIKPIHIWVCFVYWESNNIRIVSFDV